MADEVMIYGALNHASNDIDLQGGGIDLSTIIITTPLGSPMPLGFVSSSSADVGQTYSIEGINEFGLQVSEEIVLNGTTEVETTKSINPFRIRKTAGAGLIGTVTVSQIDEVVSLPSAADAPTSVEVTKANRLFHRVTTAARVGVEFFEKVFFRNNSGTTVTNVRFDERNDPLDSVLFGLDRTINGTTISFNRIIKPSLMVVTHFQSILQSTSNLTPGDAIGVWIRLARPGGDPRPYVPWKFRFRGTSSSEISKLLISTDPTRDVGETIMTKRNRFPIGGGNPQRFMELVGASEVPMSLNEPDPRTFRFQFYYNTRTNRLFKKLNTKPWPVWKLVR